MKNIFKILLFIVGGFFVGNLQVKAQIVNSGFESGVLTPWVGSPGAGISNGLNLLGWTVTPGGTFMSILQPETANDLNKAQAETNLGLTPNSLNTFNFDVFNTSTGYGTLTQDFNLNAGQTIQLYWNFIAQDYAPFNDGVFATFTGPDGFQSIKLLAVTANAYGTPGTIVTGDYGSTDWHLVSFTAGAAGTYRLGFACFNFLDDILHPILSNDNPPGGTSSPGLAVLSSAPVSATACSTAVSGGEVTADGGSSISDRGIVWNTIGSPTLADNSTSVGAGTGPFTANLTGLIVGQNYHVRSYATNAAGTAYGPTIIYNHSAICPPTNCTTPTNFTATPTINNVLISFTKAPSATLTFIQYRVKGTLIWGGTSVAGSSHTFNNLTPNTLYEYRLRSTCGASSFSNFVSGEFTTLPAPPPNFCLPPSNVNVVTSPGSVSITWDNPAFGALNFIQIKTSAASWAQAGGVSTALNNRTFNNLQPNVTYNYRIRTTCTAGATVNGMSNFTPVGTFTTSALTPNTALFDTENKTWSVYPNPTNDLINLDFNAQEEAPMQFQVLDMTGRVLQVIESQSLMGTNQVQISLGQYKPGMYIIKAIQNNELVHLSKVSKQ